MTVDGRRLPVGASDNLLHACLSHGFDLPYFCWHPELGSVGACRQCAVKQYRDENDHVGRLVMACMTPAAGASISIGDAQAGRFRSSVVESLMVNHPHDCPVCPEGGHCHLQDMTLMTGHTQRRYRFTKRTHRSQWLGPFIAHEMNRCIGCYRCVRFYRDYAGGDDLGVYGAAENVYFGRVRPGVLESEFSGNLVDVCPTGVFTDKTHGARYNRKWDMQFAPSVCQGCSLGCNISPGERYGELRRVENRYNAAINHYFLCDRGQFGHGFVNREDRPGQPLSRVDGALVAVSAADALARAQQRIRQAKRCIGIGSPRASLEANFALRGLVGAENFYDGHAAFEGALVKQAAELVFRGEFAVASLRDIEAADCALVLGEDVPNTAARMALALRQAARAKRIEVGAAQSIPAWHAAALSDHAQDARYPIFVACTTSTRLDAIAQETYRAEPVDLANLGFAVAHVIDAAAPIDRAIDEKTGALAQRIAAALLAAERPLIVSGTGAGDESVLAAAANVARALVRRGRAPSIALVVPEANSMGFALLDARPLDAALEALTSGDADLVVVLENDLYRRAPAPVVDAAFDCAASIVIDHQLTRTAARADLVLCAASFAECDGTLVNNEGRAQRFFQVFEPRYYRPECDVRASWRWLAGLSAEFSSDLLSQKRGESLDEVPIRFDEMTRRCADAFPLLSRIVEAAPRAGYRLNGLKIARESHRYSGRTAMRADISVHEPRQPQDADTALAFSMEGHRGTQAGERPPALTPFAWSPGWNSPQAWNKFQVEVGGALRGDLPGAVLRPANSQLGGASYADPRVVERHDSKLIAVPSWQLFGSEELSARCAPIQARAGQASLRFHPSDADACGVHNGATVTIVIGGATATLPMQTDPMLPRGAVAIPVGCEGVPFFVPGSAVDSVSGISP